MPVLDVIEQRVAERLTGMSIAALAAKLTEKPGDGKPLRVTGGFPKPGGGSSRGYYLEDLLLVSPKMAMPNPGEIHKEGEPEPEPIVEEEEEEPPPPPFSLPMATLEILWDLDPADYTEQVAAYIATDPRAEEWFRKHPPFPHRRAGGGAPRPQAAPQGTPVPPPQARPHHSFGKPAAAARPRPNTARPYHNFSNPKPPPYTGPIRQGASRSAPNGNGMLIVAGVIVVCGLVSQVPRILTGGPAQDISVIRAQAGFAPPSAAQSVAVVPPQTHANNQPATNQTCSLGAYAKQYDLDPVTCKARPKPPFVDPATRETSIPCHHPAPFDGSKYWFDESTCQLHAGPSNGYMPRQNLVPSHRASWQRVASSRPIQHPNPHAEASDVLYDSPPPPP